MNSFDKLILDAMVNVASMLEAKSKVLKQKRAAGYDVSGELQRAKAFVRRYDKLMADWQYWYYEDLPGAGVPPPRKGSRPKDR